MNQLLRLSRPASLVFVTFTYLLGLGVARYLGQMPVPAVFLAGWGFVLLLLTSANLLVEYFRPFTEPILEGETRKERETLRRQLLFAASGLLFVAVVLLVLLFLSNPPSLSGTIFLALFGLLGLFMAVPPVRLVDRGFGELALALLVANFSPAIAFILQQGDLHRLLTYLTFPLTLLGLAYLLILNFPAFAADQKYGRRSLLTSLTWERAVPLHNALIIAAYLLFCAAPFFGIPFAIIWPVLLSLPVAIYQVILLRNIANGDKPIWPLLVAVATALFAIVIYLLAFTFWFR